MLLVFFEKFFLKNFKKTKMEIRFGGNIQDPQLFKFERKGLRVLKN
jgi:hypothetical protein